MQKLKLQWDKSDRRCTVEAGESSVSVRRFGRKGSYQWMVDSVFGAKWQDDDNYSSAEDAMYAAELVARSVFASIAERFVRCRGGWVLAG